MDNKDGKKKESIDDILSDLNGLLNKMPSILDGIKMPDIKPVDFESPAPAPVPVPVPEPEPIPEPVPDPEPEEKKAEDPVFDADRTVIIEPFSNLPEGAPIPVEESEPAASNEDAVAFAAPGPGDFAGFTFDEPAREPAADVPATPAIEEVQVPGNEPENFPVVAHEDSPVMEIPANDEPTPGQPAQADASALPEAGLAADNSGASEPAVPGVESILNIPDAAMQAPEASLNPAAEPGSPVQPATSEMPVNDPSEDDLAEFERQLSSAVPQEAVQSQAEAQPAVEPQPVETAASDIPMDPAIERPAAAMGEYQETEQAPVLEPAAELSLNAGADAAAETLKFEPPAAAQQLEPGPGAQVPGMTEEMPVQGIQLEPAVNFADTLSAQEPLQAGDGLNAEAPQEPALSVGREGSDQGEATLVVAPPQNSGGDGEKTVVFQPSVGPGVTNRAKLEDLDKLSNLQVPEGIPVERVRPMMFIYSQESGALCANLLAELDAICQRSQATPMFIKRAAVKPFDPDLNANFVLQTVTDSGAAGLVCVGDVPQEKLYEMENIFGSAGAYFRHYDRDSFSHTAMLDLLLEVILR